jgi:GMP synthase (glutamine-hydrolysing)
VTTPHPHVAVIQHEDGCPLGLFDGWMRAAGAAVAVVRPDTGDRLPSVGEIDGLVVLGGSMSATDDDRHPWLPGTRELLGHAVDAGLPTLGICLGHQLLVVACGGRVEANPAGKQTGVVPVGFTGAAATSERLFASVQAGPAAAGIQWNSDIAVDLPAFATVLATTPAGVAQAIRVGDVAWGVQFHPEADHAIVAAWAESEGPVTPAERAALADIADAAPELEATWRPFAARFVEIASDRPVSDSAVVTSL